MTKKNVINNKAPQVERVYTTNHGIITLSDGIKVGSIASDEKGNLLKSKILYDFDEKKHFHTDSEGKITLIY